MHHSIQYRFEKKIYSSVAGEAKDILSYDLIQQVGAVVIRSYQMDAILE